MSQTKNGTATADLTDNADFINKSEKSAFVHPLYQHGPPLRCHKFAIISSQFPNIYNEAWLELV